MGTTSSCTTKESGGWSFLLVSKYVRTISELHLPEERYIEISV